MRIPADGANLTDVKVAQSTVATKRFKHARIEGRSDVGLPEVERVKCDVDTEQLR